MSGTKIASYRTFCRQCGMFIYPGEEIMSIRGKWVHSDCDHGSMAEMPVCPHCQLAQAPGHYCYLVSASVLEAADLYPVCPKCYLIHPLNDCL